MCIQPLRAPKDVYPEVWLLYACPHLHAHTHTYARSSICTRARTRTYAHTYIRTLKQTSRIETNLGQRTRNSTCKQKSESFDIVFSHFRSFITFSQLVFHIFPTCFLTFITFSFLSYIFSQYGGLEVSTSSTALSSLTDAVLELYGYMFDCSEQLASRTLGIVGLKDVSVGVCLCVCGYVYVRVCVCACVRGCECVL